MMNAEDFVFLSELGLNQDQIRAHFRATQTELETIARDNWQCSASEANDRLRQAGPVALLAAAAKRAQDGNERLIMFLLEKLWRPAISNPAQRGADEPTNLTPDQLTRVWQIMREGGDGV